MLELVLISPPWIDIGELGDNLPLLQIEMRYADPSQMK